MPARLGDLLEDATEHIVVVEEREPCGAPHPEPVDAVADLIAECVNGCVLTEHLCGPHLELAQLCDEQGLLFHTPCRPDGVARIVAVYPRRTS